MDITCYNHTKGVEIWVIMVIKTPTLDPMLCSACPVVLGLHDMQAVSLSCTVL